MFASRLNHHHLHHPLEKFLNTALLVDCLDGRTIHITTMIVIYIRQLVLNTAYSWARHTKRWNTCIANQRIIRGHSQAIYSLKGWALHKIAQCCTQWNVTRIYTYAYLWWSNCVLVLVHILYWCTQYNKGLSPHLKDRVWLLKHGRAIKASDSAVAVTFTYVASRSTRHRTNHYWQVYCS